METNEITKKSAGKKQSAQEMSIIKLISTIIDATEDAKTLLPTKAKSHISELQKRLGFETAEEAVLLAVCINMVDEREIRLKDIARHFKVSTIDIIEHLEDLDDLVKRQILTCCKGNKEVTYHINMDVVCNIRQGVLPVPKIIENLTMENFIIEISATLNKIDECEITNSEAGKYFDELIEKNQHLYMAQKLKAYNFNLITTITYFVLVIRFVYYHDDEVCRNDLDGYMSEYALFDQCSSLQRGDHVLMQERLVEHANSDGQIVPDVWKLTDYSKEDILRDLNMTKCSESRANLLHYEDIKEKSLYYNEKVTREVDKLRNLLRPERMERVLQRLEDNGMRKGFTCIFYGGPGTGKTETVLQLARETQRDIMLVDVPNIRSKWVGDTEKNIKRVFDMYRQAANGSIHAPILVFNEADAILNKRNEGGTSGVDKMENSMQNIILQEMENLEGIMIATTNLTGNLDSAFERRFLYKIEFEKPTANERKHIWKSMLSDLTDEQAFSLASQYDFSGGQIENIARKRIISDILDDSDVLNMNGIIESCNVELLTKKYHKIGF